MKRMIQIKFVLQILLAACLLSTFIIAPSKAESQFGIVTGEPLETLCLSDDRLQRGMCIGYIKAILAILHGELTAAEIQCFAIYLLPLRNAALHGWSQIQDTLRWVDDRLAAGDIPTEGEKWAIEQSQKLVDDVKHRKQLFVDIRSGNPPLLYKLCLSRHQ